MTTFKTFRGTNPPIFQLPSGFRDSVQASQAGRSTSVTDQVVGSATAGRGYCALPKFRQQLYCACVNAPIANPECVFAPCANYSQAYKTARMQKALKDAAKDCPETVNCTQIFKMGGSGNIATGVSQSMNCGGTVEKVITNVEAHPVLAVLFVVLVLVLAFLLGSGETSSRDSATGAGGLPPPQLVLPPSI